MSVLEQTVLKYPDKKWNELFLSINPNISLKFILSNKNINWNKSSIIKPINNIR